MGNNVSMEELKRLKDMERKQKERYKKQNEHTNKLYDRISFTVPKGKKQEIEVAAKNAGMTVNKFISEVMLKVIINNDILKMIFNNNIKNLPEKITESVQNAETAAENQIAEIHAPVQTKMENQPYKNPMIAEELQALIDKRKAEEAERKRQIEERKSQREEERQQEFRSMINGVVNGLKSRKEQRMEEDRRGMPEEAIAELIQDAKFDRWLENAGFENALEQLSKEIGISNAEKVISVAKEKKRKESTENSKCLF